MRQFAVLLCLMPLLLSGCIFYEQDTELNENGSGSMEIHYWIKEDVLSWFKGGALSFNEDSVRTQYTSEGISINSVRIEARDPDSTRHVFVSLDFNDITQLSVCKGFADVDIKWMREGDVYRFVQKLPVTSSSGDGMLDNFTFTYRYDFPGEIRESNADTVDGDHAVWVFKLSDLNASRKMEAVIVASSGSNVWWIIGILLVVAAIALVLVRLRKKK